MKIRLKKYKIPENLFKYFKLYKKGESWILRSDIIWSKPNPMPSSVKDRLNTTYEHIFHFVKSRKYFYDLDAIREPHTVCGVTDNRPMGVLRQRLYPNSKYNKEKRIPFKPYSIQERNKEFIEYRNLPDIKEFSNYLNESRKWKSRNQLSRWGICQQYPSRKASCDKRRLCNQKSREI